MHLIHFDELDGVKLLIFVAALCGMVAEHTQFRKFGFAVYYLLVFYLSTFATLIYFSLSIHLELIL